MAQQFSLNLKQIPDEQFAKMIGEMLLQQLVVGTAIKKQVGKDFLTKCQRNLQDQKTTPQLKYLTLCIFRFLDLKNKNSLKLFSIITSHTIFAYFIQTARKIDPKKAVSQKGKKLFPNNIQLGNKFIRLILESLKFWSQRFPNNSNQQATKYKKYYLQLEKEGVTFPSSYNFYEPILPSQQKGEKVVKKNSVNQKQIQKVQSKVQSTSPLTGGATDTGNPLAQEKVSKSSIMLLFNKIQTFISFLQDSQSIEQMQRQVKKNHKTFDKQQKRLQNSNVLSIEDEKILNLYLKINQFFLSQKVIYEQQMVQNNSLKTYVDAVFIKYDSIFAQQLAQEDKPRQSIKKAKSQSPQKQQKSTVKNQQKPKLPYNSTTSNKQNSIQEKRKYQSVVTQKQRVSKKRQQDDEQEPRQRLKQKRSNVQNQQIKDKGLRSFFDSHLEKPVKSVSGFKAIKQSIQKQKNQMKIKARGKSPINSMSRTKFNASTVSKIQTNSIFAKPPNPHVRAKQYQGTFVNPNYDLQNITYQIQRQQGMKRFKISNLKNRALLYQSQHVQIGYKSQPVYQRVEGLQNGEQMIQLQLFIGNKSKSTITNVQVSFLGDQRSLVYSNPQKAPDSINAGDQCLFTVIIIPCAQNYSMTTMSLSYQADSYPIRSIIVLPSTILKFISYEKADVRDMTGYQKTKSTKCYQTQKFLLSHYFPPRKLQHYIEQLNQITSYSQFAQNGSQKDFALGAFIMIKNKYSGLLKINVRPDLNVVIQLMSNDDSQQAQCQFKLYLQTLNMVLKEHRV